MCAKKLQLNAMSFKLQCGIYENTAGCDVYLLPSHCVVYLLGYLFTFYLYHLNLPIVRLTLLEMLLKRFYTLNPCCFFPKSILTNFHLINKFDIA